ncbi:beta-galactosidase [Vagococcus sp. PNs007]|uniref:Beta-galactosidase n=1 Tax=Vagococcus proximus TaxID=2991417 RepID=A0ABT5X311_9ENTE|nr:beta-galactosidase family protein [Vagococcus proximus]MDF0480304.1 beta-galactosidase [Vagococcus proximus]
MKFEVNKEFLIDGKPTKLISGAVHYFRIIPEKWRDTLYNLKAMGCNTVETYIPWNVHEPQKGKFNFEGLADIEAFCKLAQEMELFIILRPSPYICAEWEFGGLPAWLLEDPKMRIRSQYNGYIQAVDDYYSELIPRLFPYQTTQGGSVLMMQVENEYGSFGNDKDYLKLIASLLKKYGAEIPLFTSDGGWEAALDSGGLAEDSVLATANFGSDANSNFKALEAYHMKYGKEAPLMCMEFWDGWFNNWGEEIIKRDPNETAEEVREILKRGSINFYMFHGGTNFGFYNGCSDQFTHSTPQITSYDYDAPLTEWGMPTEKFYAIQKVIEEECPNVETFEPKLPVFKNIGCFQVKEKVSLPSILTDLTSPVKNDYPLTMEEMGQSFGYIMYRTELTGPRKTALKVTETGDRVQFFVNNELKATQYQNEVGEEVPVDLPFERNILDILVENQGRNNYGPTLISPQQRKGIRGGIREDIHYISGWEHYNLSLDNSKEIDFSKEWIEGSPSFYRCEVKVPKPENTFLDCRNFGKGVVYLNGFHLGRYWSKGPTSYLFVPKELWRNGVNTLIIFETEGNEIENVSFSDHPVYVD